ncbi:helix-turn-helix domain-containing protein [Streptomyces sp. NPDC101733]|uniref:helix-turn-helix domain-containing protein n=1 Tax=unclassified Streptomyces TaxID=2593676 RepID=UPI00380497A5
MGTERSVEAERFARLMRELKERAGLSYGVLARRLHTSTSTLHRYCKGEAVPAEFAVVDRFARACGAEREEAVELHRAWLLADARRRAGTAAGAATATGTAAGPAAGVGAEAVEPSAPSASAPSEGPSSERAPVEAPVVRYGRLRRRVLAVAVSGVVAGAVVAALVVAAPERGRGGSPAVAASAGPTGSGPGSPSLAGSPAPSGAGTESPGTAPAGATGGSGASPSAGPDPGGATDGAPGGAARGPAPGSGGSPAPPVGVAPLGVAVRSHVWASGCDHAYLSDRAPAAVPAPPVQADAPGWARAQRAVHAGTQIVEVTLHGKGEGAVVLEGLEVRVAARRTPPAWNVYRMSQGCGGALTPATFAVNLDAPRPLARGVAGNDAGEPLPAPTFPMRVSAAEPVVLRVEAATTGCDCDWYLDLRWSGPEGSGTLRLDDGGPPWRISASGGRPAYGFASELGRWAR